MTHTAVLTLGSNVARAACIIEAARAAIDRVAEVRAYSGAYLSPDDTGAGADYLNAVLELTTTLSLSEMADFAAGLEQRSGRTADSKSRGVMPLDVDIVVWDTEVIKPYDTTRPYFRTGYQKIHHESHLIP